ncbi:nucleoside triphosphate pyrophosphohydrolase [bacterium]|nr:nucleoside triphosphate pyrophosphohydrolase [bacterium]
MSSGEHNQKNTNGITLIGLGPGDPGALTREAWDWLETIDTLYLRTMHHPTVADLPDGLTLESFDAIYEKHDDFQDVYAEIIETVIAKGQTADGVTYAVPGHPFVAEDTCPEIARLAAEMGIPCRVIDGLSFMEPTFRALGMDPFPSMTLADAITVSMSHTPGFSPSTPALIAQIYSKAVASDVKLTLMTVYPDEHPVRLVHGAGTAEEVVEDLPLYELDHSPHLGLLSSLFVPTLDENASFEAFQEIVARLRAPDGCPWDREQTHISLRPYLIEEAYEALDALDRADMADLQEELGDILLQIVLHAQIGVEDGDFNINQVIEGIGSKLIRRHPHVFSEVEVADVSGVIQNWEAIKAEERQESGESSKKGLLDGVPQALPALLQADEIVERVGRVRFDRLEKLGDPATIRETLDKLESAGPETLNDRLGELLLGIASFAHAHEVGVEDALREALNRFRARFDKMEADALAEGKALVDLSDEEKASRWAAAGETDDEGA